MGLPSGMHGSQMNMNHIRLINKLTYLKARYNYLSQLYRHMRLQRALYNNTASILTTKSLERPQNLFKVHNNSISSMPLLSKLQKRKLGHMKKSVPIVSNMPFIHVNSSLILGNSSPFALTDQRFGILHHNATSISYF